MYSIGYSPFIIIIFLKYKHLTCIWVVATVVLWTGGAVPPLPTVSITLESKLDTVKRTAEPAPASAHIECLGAAT